VPGHGIRDRALLALAAALLGGTALVVPAGYLLLSLRHEEGGLETEAAVVAQAVTSVVTANPDLWRFEQVRLEELLLIRKYLDENKEYRYQQAGLEQ